LFCANDKKVTGADFDCADPKDTQNFVSTQPQAATHWLVRDLFKLTAEASASHLSSYKISSNFAPLAPIRWV
jgi:hypothetical protein